MSCSELSATGNTRSATVSDEDVRAFYQANKDRTNQTFEQLAPQIKQYLASQHNDDAVHGFYQELRAKHGIISLLEPYRVSVPTAGPARGKATASVAIVEFADFQCPYCKQEESALRAALSKYPDDVRLVYRHLPLTQIHPNAMTAAEAAVCADRQGKFWDMHDAMFADQSALGAEALKDTAKRLGLDVDQLSKCVSDSATAQAIQADTKAADDIGIESTPYLFINGRPISGTASEEKLEALIADELRLDTSHVARAR